MPCRSAAPHRFLGGPVVVRSGRPVADRARARLPRSRCTGKSLPVLRLSREGETARPHHRLAAGSAGRHLPAAPDRCRRSYRRGAADRGAAKGFRRRFRPLLAAGGPALWRPLGAQLGDRGFHRSRGADRTRAISLGADGVGLNPLHALFDDRPADCSPYSPNSRLFLNALYIDVEKLPEFQPAPAESSDALARLRQSDIVDYAGVAELKWRALRVGFRDLQGQSQQPNAGRISRDSAPSARRCCRASPVSRCCGTNSTSRGGNGRKNGGSPTRPNAPRCAQGPMRPRSNSSNSCNGPPTGSCGACQDLATRLGMKVGLYLDVAVGVQSDGFDAWNEQVGDFAPSRASARRRIR